MGFRLSDHPPGHPLRFVQIRLNSGVSRTARGQFADRQGDVTLLGHDEVAAQQGAAGPWTVICETCEKLALAAGRGRDSINAAHIGYYATEAEADAARARHVDEAGDR